MHKIHSASLAYPHFSMRSARPRRSGATAATLWQTACAVAVLGVALSAPAQAQAPALPAPETVTLDKLGYMSTFPPEGAQRVDLSNSYKYPQLRWAVQHLRELQPTRNIRRGGAAPSALPADPRPLGAVAFDDDKGQPITVDQWFTGNYTDALVVMHKGRVVYERYDNQMKPYTPHLLFSVTKSFTGLMAAQLHALQPIQYELRALNAPQLAQCNGQSVLTRIGELALNDIADSRQGPMIVSGNALENIDWRTFPEESKHISGSSCVVSKCEGLVHRLYMRASQDTASFDS